MLDRDAIPVLRELKSRGYRIGLVSNWDGTLATMCNELGLAEYIDYIGDSTVFGQAKPSPAFCLHVLDRLGVPPDAAFHVEDDYDADVEGARASNITPILVDVFEHEDRSCEYCARGLRDVLELAEAIDRQLVGGVSGTPADGAECGVGLARARKQSDADSEECQ